MGMNSLNGKSMLPLIQGLNAPGSKGRKAVVHLVFDVCLHCGMADTWCGEETDVEEEYTYDLEKATCKDCLYEYRGE